MGLAVAAVLAVNIAGIWGIAMARRAALDEARRSFRESLADRARALEVRLASVRSDLAFLAASSGLARLSPEEVRGVRSALLVFLRGHPEVIRVEVTSESGEPLLHAGRRGGVPVLWLSTRPTGREGAAMAPGRPRLVTRAPAVSGDSRASLELEVDPVELLGVAAGCRLADAEGRRLAGDEQPPGGGFPVPVSAPDWSAPSPWQLECPAPELAVTPAAGPVATRYRTTLLLNLAVMALALFLGAFAFQQARRRERLEARAREEARVRALERQLLHAERLTTVGRLAAGIAHEINNPLEGMANWISLARDALESGDSDRAGAHLDRVREGLGRAAGIVRRVLDHADPAHAPMSELDLNDVLRETAEFVRSRREFSGIEFGFELCPGPLRVKGSPVMLGQVVVNLILNACEAQPERGEVRVSSRRDGLSAVAELADRGPGVPEEDRERIFEPFFSTKDSSGLGLSICHTIVRQHDGELSVSPRPDGGTGAVFRMRLPALEAESAR